MNMLDAAILAGVGAAFALAFRHGRGWASGPARALYLAVVLGAAVAAARFVATVVGWVALGTPFNIYDFEIFYRVGAAARAGAPLYDLAGIRQDPGRIVVYRHAPIGAVVFAPLSWLPFPAALALWRLLNVGVYLATLAWLLHHFRLAPRAPLALGLAALWLASAPGRVTLGSGQWDVIFLAAATAALGLLARGRDGWAGACLALPIALKFYPALLLLTPLLSRRGIARRCRAVAGCALAGVALTLLGLLVAGPENTRVFFAEVLPAVGGGTVYFENQTPYAFIGRLLAADLRDNGLDARYPAALTATLARAVGLGVIVATALVVRRRGGGELAAALRFATPLAASLLVIPTAWGHYAAWLLLPIVVLGVALARERLPRPVLACFVVAATLILFGTEGSVWGPGPHDGAARLLLTYKVYGFAALWAGVALAAWRLSGEGGAGCEKRLVGERPGD